MIDLIPFADESKEKQPQHNVLGGNQHTASAMLLSPVHYAFVWVTELAGAYRRVPRETSLSTPSWAMAVPDTIESVPTTDLMCVLS